MWYSDKSPDTEKRLTAVLDFVRKNPHSTLYHDLPETRGNALESLASIVPITKEMLRSHGGNLIHYPEREVRYLVSEFDEAHADRLFLFAQRTDTVWKEIDAELKRHDPIVAILSVPLFWQMGPMMYRATRENKIPISVLSPRNLPLARQVIAEVGAEFIATTPDVAGALHALLVENSIGEQIQSWHLITELGKRASIPNLPGRVILEHHLFPGVPVGITTEAMLQKGDYGFVANDEFLFEVEAGNAYVTSLALHAIPLVRYRIEGDVKTRDGIIEIV